MNLEDLVKSLAWGAGYDIGARVRYLHECRSRGWDYTCEKIRYHAALSAARWVFQKAKQTGYWDSIRGELRKGVRDGRKVP